MTRTHDVDMVHRLYAVGHSARAVGLETNTPYGRVLDIIHDIVRPSGPKPRAGCVDCGKPVVRHLTNGASRNPSGARCLFHQRLRWSEYKARATS